MYYYDVVKQVPVNIEDNEVGNIKSVYGDLESKKNKVFEKYDYFETGIRGNVDILKKKYGISNKFEMEEYFKSVEMGVGEVVYLGMLILNVYREECMLLDFFVDSLKRVVLELFGNLVNGDNIDRCVNYDLVSLYFKKNVKIEFFPIFVGFLVRKMNKMVKI